MKGAPHKRMARKPARADGAIPLPTSPTRRARSEISFPEQRLLGEINATWSADESVLKLLDEGVPGQRRVVAVAPGSTKIQVDALDVSTSLDVEVVQ